MINKIIGNIITDGKIIKNGEVCFENGKIISVGERTCDEGYNVTDFGEKYVSAGFVDIHLHGGGGSDFMDGTVEAYLTAARLHGKHGTTAMLPTTLTCPDEELYRTFETFKIAQNTPVDGSDLCGLHLEGPYFSPAQKGAQDERFLKKPTPEHYMPILEAGKGIIKRWTVAPELEGAMELGKILKENGILASMGHSDAEYTTVVEGYENGYTLLTHFYSGMSSMVRRGGFRIPGMIESGYIIDDMRVEVIADGCHLPPCILGSLYRIKGADKMCLVTDSMRGAGQTSGTTILGSLENGYEVFIEDGVAKMPDRQAFAGSIATADRLIRTVYKQAGVPIWDAVKMMTETPAKFAGLENKGSLSAGKDADIAVFDDDINICAVYVRGKEITNG